MEKNKEIKKADTANTGLKKTNAIKEDGRVATAYIKSVKISPIKLAALTRTISGMMVSKAVATLTFSTKKVAKDVNKLLKSAMSNAENNHGLDIDKLYIKRIDVGKSMVLKRFTARARGRGSRIFKPFSNIRIVLSEKKI